MEFKNFTKRITTSFVLILIFTILILFYDAYLKFFIYFIYLAIIFELFIYFRINIYIFFISLIYVFISLICLDSYLRNYYIKEEFIYTISLVVIFDVVSYAFGTKFGKLKILPSISPNKTYIGFFSGFIITFIVGSLYNYYYLFFKIDLMIYFIFFTLSFAFFGDIIESIFKRKCNLKNSSEFLPGHGGFFDRFDSLITVVIWLFLFNLLI